MLHRASLQTDFLLAVVIQFQISTYQAQLRISLRKQLLLFLVAKKTKQDILTHTVSYKTSLALLYPIFKLDVRWKRLLY